MDKITAAALLLASGEVISLPPPARHPSLIMEAQARGLELLNHRQGFLTSTGTFVTRGQAYGIALAAGQLLYDPTGTQTPGTLYTEDIF